MPVHVFGVRHLSPAGAWHLRRYLDDVRPDVVLIEGMSDTEGLIKDILRKDSVPPIAILAYTDDLPVRTILYPFAEYSPEYQALRWAKDNKARAEFIDLPSDIFLALENVSPATEEDGEGDRQGPQSREELSGEADRKEAEKRKAEQEDEDEFDNSMVLELSEPPPPSLYDRFAQHAGENDYDSYWERNFEHNTAAESYRLAAVQLGLGLRNTDTDSPRRRAENLVREAYMRRRINEVLVGGVAPEKVVAVVGAFHAPVLGDDLPPMTDEELASLPRRSCKLTLMPYSYYRLSSQSGYGAGNSAPAYFELMWQALEQDDLEQLPHRYLTMVARNLRETGTHRSTAEVIEGVRLAQTLSALKGGLAPTLRDLRDAAVTLIGQGQSAAISEALARVDMGTSIGRLPKGVSRTSIQEDFDRELDRLKLEKYRSTVKQELQLDLRENRRAKTAESAFLDLNRSSFLNRLRVLGVSFAEPVRTSQQSATWAERWNLQWSPESEIQLVEAVLLGETVELATGYRFRSILEKCSSVADAAGVVRNACECGMMSSMEEARRRLQELSAETADFRAIAGATLQLGTTARYGDVRRFDPRPLHPLISELLVQGALSLFSMANCDNAAAKENLVAMDSLNRVNLEYHELVDEELWVEELRKLSDADDRNPLLSGYACAILLERDLISGDDLVREVSRRLSPGIPADLGAGWFEGLSQRNRYALIARQLLWVSLADYVSALDDEQFRRAIVFLRRAFGTFSPQEKRQIAENLGEHWGVNPDTASELIHEELTEAEEQALDDLNDFDFDDL
ncbi:MAG: hypothetical protein KDA89_18485 [Planctomycetaceae bacterium]|nr:hypothetical protein [Planctomycetaceae bacterium]